MKFPVLLYNANAHFHATEKYPDGLTNALCDNGVEGLNAVCWALAELSNQAELVRRDLGYDKKPMLTEEYFALRLKFPDVIQAKGLIIQAITDGLNVDDEDKEVDEVLQELEKKTDNAE